MFWFCRLSADFPGRPNRPRHPAHFVSNNLWGHRVEWFFHWVMRKPWQQARPIPTGLGRGGFSTHANETGQIWYITLRWTDQRLILENISIRYIIGGTFGSGLCTMKRQLWSLLKCFYLAPTSMASPNGMCTDGGSEGILFATSEAKYSGHVR